MGYRFRLHCKDLPGKPDIVLPKYQLCILSMAAFGINTLIVCSWLKAGISNDGKEV